MSFNDLHLAAPLLAALKEEGYTTPTPIQAQAIPAILEGRDLLGSAQTGTGKTAAFALPILHKLLTMPVDKGRRGPALPRALILAPTRELAEQIGESFATYGRHTGLVHTCIYGGVSQFHQVRALHRGVDILVATPGRLEDLMEQQIITLKEVRVLILDEADRMLDMGFIQPIRRIAAAVPSTPEKPRHTLLFSATMPREIMHLADSLLKNPIKVAVAAAPTAVPLITQSLYLVPKGDKQSLLHHLLDDRAVRRAVVFTKTKFGADRVSKRLRKAGVTAGEIHGNKAQNQRQRALDAFRDGRMRVLVATDVAARGLDVDGITHVFNFDLPMEPESYVHRIGRTGRAGATGIAVSFCDGSERGLLKDIERLTGKKIPVTPVPQDMEYVDGTPEPIESFKPGHSVQPARKPLNKKGTNKLHAGGHAQGDGHHKPKDSAAHHHTTKPTHGTAPKPAHPDRKHDEAKHAPAPASHKPHAAPASPTAHSAARPATQHAHIPLTDPIKPKPAKTPHDHPAYSSMVEHVEVEPVRPMPKYQSAAHSPAPHAAPRSAPYGKSGPKKPYAPHAGSSAPAPRGDRDGFTARPERTPHNDRADRSAPHPHADKPRKHGSPFNDSRGPAKPGKSFGGHAPAPKHARPFDAPPFDAPRAGKFSRDEKPAHPLKGGAHAPRPSHAKAAPGGWKPALGKPGRGAGHAHGSSRPGGGAGKPGAGAKRSRPWG
ncbi:MAG: DEAD/DEAH box helicase [Phycisphaerales bacterium]